MPRSTPELSLHYAVADLLTRAAMPGVVWWHTNNNGGNRRDGARQGAKMKRLGVLAGVADFIIITGDIGHHRTCFMELKSAKGQLSPSQLAFQASVVRLGCFYEVIRSVDEATEFLRDIGAIRSSQDSRASVKKRAA